MTFPGISGAPLLIKPLGGIRVQDIFNTSLWSGTAASRTITTNIDSTFGSLMWIKARSTTYINVLADTVRGTTNVISTESTNAEQVVSTGVTGTSSSGYSLGSWTQVNNTTVSYVGWQFRRAEKFFDIVQYTGNGVSGRSISHNLGIKPGMIIVKRIDSATSWIVQHISRGASQYGILNAADAFYSDASFWVAEPTSSDFKVGTPGAINASGGTYIAYLFAHDPSSEGIIQCGSYVGNGSATGPVVNLGWRPQYLMIKNATSTGNWIILDTQRAISQILTANTTDAEVAAAVVSLNSNGFQISTTSGGVNSSGQTYIYMAIREA